MQRGAGGSLAGHPQH